MPGACLKQTADSPEQEYLRRLWAIQLERSDIGLNDDFFEVGGSSMQAIEMLMTVCTHFDREIDFGEFFKDPCIDKLRELLTT